MERYGGQPKFRDLLKAGKALLISTSDNSSQALRDTLTASSTVLPEWRSRDTWNEDTELEEIGQAEDTVRRSTLLDVVGRRSLDILLALQVWLELENTGLPPGFKETDLLLGTTDIRVIKQLVAQVLSFSVLPAARAHVHALKTRQLSDTAEAGFSSLLSQILDLLSRRSAQTGEASSSRPPAVAPLTLITQVLIESHLWQLLLATIVLAYTPTRPPSVHLSLRQHLMSVLVGALSPKTALNGLSGVLRATKTSKTTKLNVGAQEDQMSADWSGAWPDYVETTVGGMMSAQLRRSGGIQALIASTLGEAASQSSKAAVDDRKLDHVSKILSTLPRPPVEPVEYINSTLESLMELVQPRDGAEAAPWGYIQAASHAVHAVWRKHPTLAEPWLKAYLEGTFRPVVATEQVQECRNTGEAVTLLSADAAESTTKAMLYLLDYAPPDRKYAHFLVDPFLPALYAMCRAVSEGKPLPPRPVAKEGEPDPPPDPACYRLLYTWSHLVGKDAAQAGLGRSQGTQMDEPMSTVYIPDGFGIEWRKDGTSAALVLVAKDPSLKPSTNARDGQALATLFEYLDMSDPA